MIIVWSFVSTPSIVVSNSIEPVSPIRSSDNLVENIVDPETTTASKTPNAAVSCLSPDQIETHPLLAAEAYRWDAVAVTGPTIQSYRGLSSSELGNLSSQGDSAAMAALGAISIMQARDLPEESAIPYLLLEDTKLRSYSIKRPLEPEVQKHYQDASDWFYKAALHGRIMALYDVGDVLWQVEGGAVALGWIDKDEYDSLSNYEKGALNPANVYSVLPYELAPQLRDGPMGEIIAELMPSTERQQQIVGRLAKQFEQDRQDAGLPAIIVAESNAPPMEELLALICEQYLEAEQNRVR